jgi:hypothetical protein
LNQGKNAEAEPMLRRLHTLMMRVRGAEDPETLGVAGNLATWTPAQAKASTLTLHGSSARCMRC